MVSLLDLAGALAPATIVVRGQEIAISGLSITVIARLIRKVPEVAMALQGQSPSIDIASLLDTAPDEVMRLIAAGTGMQDDEAGIKAAARLPIEVQTEILMAIFKETFPNGIAPFVERLSKMGGLMAGQGADVAVKAPATT